MPIFGIPGVMPQTRVILCLLLPYMVSVKVCDVATSHAISFKAVFTLLVSHNYKLLKLSRVVFQHRYRNEVIYSLRGFISYMSMVSVIHTQHSTAD